MPKDAAVNGGFGHHVAAGSVISFLRIESFDLSAVTAHDDFSASGNIVWTVNIRDAVELEVITTGVDHVATCHSDVLLRLITGDQRNADDEYCNTEMG